MCRSENSGICDFGVQYLDGFGGADTADTVALEAADEVGEEDWAFHRLRCRKLVSFPNISNFISVVYEANEHGANAVPVLLASSASPSSS